MRINEKNVEELLTNIKKELVLAYGTNYADSKDRYIKGVMGKIDALLTIVEFDE